MSTETDRSHDEWRRIGRLMDEAGMTTYDPEKDVNAR